MFGTFIISIILPLVESWYSCLHLRSCIHEFSLHSLSKPFNFVETWRWQCESITIMNTFLLWWVKRLSRDYLRPPLTVFGWRNLIYPQPWKGSLPRGHFFGKTQNFSNWYFICMYWVTTKKNMNGSKGTLYLGHYTLWFIACKDDDEVLAFYWALGDDKYFVGRKTD